MAQTQTRIDVKAAYLRRLAVVFADDLRLKIVTELYMREMSPTQFYGQFGGGSLARVDRHFKQLAKNDWLRLVRTESGGRRRGGTEHFYRATDLAVFDKETWCLLPFSIRLAFSWRTLRQFSERVIEAFSAETLDARPDRHLSWTTIVVDQVGWERVVAAVDALFESLFEEQADAKLRMFHSGEEALLATVALGAFESPARSSAGSFGQPGAGLIEVPEDLPSAEGPRLAKVFADPLCLKIVSETNLREMSAAQFHAELGGASEAGIRRRFKLLERTAWLVKVREETGGRRRGGVEQFYRATAPAIFDGPAWSDVPDAIKATYSWTTFEQMCEQTRRAMQAGTFDAREDRHLTWCLLRLDAMGWEKVIASVDALFKIVFKEQKLAKLRLGASGEEPVTTTVALAAFESPRNSAMPCW